ncbi:hypothetical protein KPH14_009059 [Odynerus spinipes]|uniref:Uncharacterized protein n=1 Tax=Odynerus spinipes TaxID=1348599 RepID=A0AAD9RP13_9HYME|nr:hypothetical protein KPH14_009059 [Odynerus spinipes]
MYADNFSSDMEENFFEALALLHSNEEDSAEKLRKMLDALIESRYGTGKTLAFRMPKEFLQKERSRWKTYSKNSVKLVAERKKEISELKNDKTMTNERSINVFKIDLEEDEIEEEERIDIPRISIPDEGSTDGALCKVIIVEII